MEEGSSTRSVDFLLRDINSVTPRLTSLESSMPTTSSVRDIIESLWTIQDTLLEIKSHRIESSKRFPKLLDESLADSVKSCSEVLSAINEKLELCNSILHITDEIRAQDKEFKEFVSPLSSLVHKLEIVHKRHQGSPSDQWNDNVQQSEARHKERHSNSDLERNDLPSPDHLTDAASTSLSSTSASKKSLPNSESKKQQFINRVGDLSFRHTTHSDRLSSPIHKLANRIENQYDPLPEINTSMPTDKVLTDLRSATQNGNVELLRDCLEMIPFGHEALDKPIVGFEGTPLMQAAASGYFQCVRFLVRAGAKVTAVDTLGRIALHYAIESGHLKIVQWLAGDWSITWMPGASLSPRQVDIQDNNGDGSLTIALLTDRNDIVRVLIDCGANLEESNRRQQTPLLIAIAKSKAVISKMLIDRGANVNHQDQKNETPLMYAARMGSADIVAKLLEKGADQWTQDLKGETAIHHACRMGHLNVVVELYTNLNDLSIRNNLGQQPLHVAAASNAHEVVAALLRIGCDANSWTKTFENKDTSIMASTPLHYACRGGYYDTVRELILYGARVNDIQNDGTTALMMACEAKNLATVRLLLGSGVDVNAKTRTEHVTALHIAATKAKTMNIFKDLPELGRGSDLTALLAAEKDNLTDIIKELLQCGANPKLATKEGEIPALDDLLLREYKPHAVKDGKRIGRYEEHRLSQIYKSQQFSQVHKPDISNSETSQSHRKRIWLPEEGSTGDNDSKLTSFDKDIDLIITRDKGSMVLRYGPGVSVRVWFNAAMYKIISIVGYKLFSLENTITAWIPLEMYLSMIELFKSYLPPGKLKMVWVCKCGYQSSDEYIELQPGSLQELGERMLRNGSMKMVTISSVSRVTALHIIQSLDYGFKACLEWGKELLNGSNNLPTSQVESESHTATDQATDYLITCAKVGPYATAMKTLEVQGFKGDEELFQGLQKMYLVKQRFFPRLFSFTKIKEINFVQFALRRNALVDRIKRNRLPPRSAQHYGYNPRPAALIPPLGSNYLLHRFHNPEDGKDDTLCLEQFPKRLRQRPRRGEHPDNDIGWGLDFVEGPHFGKIYTVLASVIGVGSLLFGLLYWVLNKDVQGAFSVASYLTSLTVLFLSTWQIRVLTT